MSFATGGFALTGFAAAAVRIVLAPARAATASAAASTDVNAAARLLRDVKRDTKASFYATRERTAGDVARWCAQGLPFWRFSPNRPLRSFSPLWSRRCAAGASYHLQHAAVEGLAPAASLDADPPAPGRDPGDHAGRRARGLRRPGTPSARPADGRAFARDRARGRFPRRDRPGIRRPAPRAHDQPDRGGDPQAGRRGVHRRRQPRRDSLLAPGSREDRRARLDRSERGAVGP